MVEKFHASGRLVLCCSLAISGALAILPAAASAGGFFIQEQSVAHQGASFAGVVSEPGDASTIFFNPAGLTKLDGAQAVSGGTLIVPRLRFNDTGSAVTTPGTPGTVGNSGGAGGNPFDPALVPNIGAATPALDGRLWFGLGVNSPFGLKTEYADGWIGRYDSTSSELLTIDVAPTVAFQATDYLSIGGGVNFQYGHATLESAIPDHTVLLPSAATDGKAVLEGDDWAVGYNVGLLFEPRDGVRIGIHYRSQMDFTLDGTLLQKMSAGLGGVRMVRKATVDLTLPRIVTAGISYDVNDMWTLMGRFGWYGWSSFDEIRVQFDAGGPDAVTMQNYRNTMSLAAGVAHRPNENLTLRTGFQWDQTPTIDRHRNTRTPDGDRYWASAGFTYAIGSHFAVDAAYSHIFVDAVDINLARGFTAIGSTATIKGEITNHIDMFSAALVYRF